MSEPTAPTALLTWGLGPVHSFISQARRIADVWAGSYLLSSLTSQAIAIVHRRDPAGQMIFPYLDKRSPDIPEGLPNRFVCRVPAARAEIVARTMDAEVRRVWNVLVDEAVSHLRSPYRELFPGPDLLPTEPGRPRQTDAVFQTSWSWVEEGASYADAARAGAARFVASRRFRSFLPIAENGEKCAICGERAALPDGDRERVRAAWQKAERLAREQDDGMARYFRFEQGRLCLVCTAKRFFPINNHRGVLFKAFDRFQETPELPYFAMVKMDGDRMGKILGMRPGQVRGGDLERFHRAVSEALSTFADTLRVDGSAAINLAVLDGYQDHEPRSQLIYAGGDDVLFVCNPKDALPLAKRIRDHYRASFDEARALLAPGERDPFTVSAAVIFAHRSHTAGLLLHDLEVLLKEGAKAKEDKNAVAIQLAKRSGPSTEVVLPWDGEIGIGIDKVQELAELVAKGEVSSRQTYTLREGERTLRPIFGDDPALWRLWLGDRLGRNADTGDRADSLACRMTPFFLNHQATALRIARFLGRELSA